MKKCARNADIADCFCNYSFNNLLIGIQIINANNCSNDIISYGRTYKSGFATLTRDSIPIPIPISFQLESLEHCWYSRSVITSSPFTLHFYVSSQSIQQIVEETKTSQNWTIERVTKKKTAIPNNVIKYQLYLKTTIEYAWVCESGAIQNVTYIHRWFV